MNIFNNLFEKKKYLDCPFMKNSLHFFYDAVRACCVNVSGPVFYSDYKGENIDFDFIYNERKKVFDGILTAKEKKYIPACCENCCDVEKFFIDDKPQSFNNEIKTVYFHNHMSCNARCVYCSYDYFDRGYGYDVLNFVKDMIERRILLPDASIYMSGGEITITNEFEELLSLLLSYMNNKVEILTSGIKYCKSIQEAFCKDKCKLIISLDSGNKNVYEKIKKVDCFDKVVQNLKDYISFSDNAKSNILLKYIIVDGINDTVQEIEDFLKLASELGILNVRIDFDFVKYRFSDAVKLPKHYFELIEYFDTSAKEKNLSINTYGQIEAILQKAKENE